jgi:hypothetical protein
MQIKVYPLLATVASFEYLMYGFKTFSSFT